MQGVTVSLTIKDKNELYKAYMPHIKHGGLFVAASGNFELGQPVTLHLTLWDDPADIELNGKIVWITPMFAQGGRPAGIGVQLSLDSSKQIKDKIEKQLAGMLQSDQMTSTF